jgi:hypothetical protein
MSFDRAFGHEDVKNCGEHLEFIGAGGHSLQAGTVYALKD